jgi:membrane protein DedA with SNARE-associated domain
MESLVDFLLNFYGSTPYWFVFGILLLCGFGLPIPEDVTLFAAGLLAYYGVTDLAWTIVLCFGGVMIGDSAMFLLGYKYGKKLTKKWFFQRLLPAERLSAASDQFKKKGSGKILFAARFMPGLRAPLFFSAGVLHVSFWRFFLSDGLAAIISVPAIVGAVYYFGDQLDHIVRIIKKIEGGIVIAVFVILGAFLLKWKLKQKKSAT